MASRWFRLCLFRLFLLTGPASAGADDDAWRLRGDLGLGAFVAQESIVGQSTRTTAAPYVYADYGPLFGRVDTFGLKLLPVGFGHLEVSTRLLQDARETSGSRPAVQARPGSRPLGLSTFQVTPVGAFGLAALRDLGDSGGALLEVNWAGRVGVAPWLTLYPQLGLEYLSGAYVDFYYGVAAAAPEGAAYHAGAARNPYLAMFTDTPLGGRWSLTASVRRKWLAAAIADSPLAPGATRWNAYAALTRRFD